MDDITNAIHGVRGDIQAITTLALVAVFIYGAIGMYEHFYPPARPSTQQVCRHERDYDYSGKNFNERVVCGPAEEVK